MMIRGSSSLKEVGDSQDSKNNNDLDEKRKKKKSSASGSGSGSTIGSNKCCSSSSWHRLKDPRIVRVSRGFGGKDRHSKVCTVRGLRDRRVRLSVPTAIQLYDLQDRLGLSQPSKVVDWLLNAAKDEIDELPPLQIPPLGFPTKYQQHDHNKEQAAVESSSLYQWDPNNSFPMHMHMHMQPSTLSLSSSNYFPLLETHNNVNVIDPTLHMQMLHHHTSSIRPDFQLPSQIKDQQHHFPPLSKYPPTSTN